LASSACDYFTSEDVEDARVTIKTLHPDSARPVSKPNAKVWLTIDLLSAAVRRHPLPADTFIPTSVCELLSLRASCHMYPTERGAIQAAIIFERLLVEGATD
jgi:hypothetical protein